MLKTIYILSLIICLLTLITTSICIVNLMDGVDDSSGNAGAFAGFVSFYIVIAGIIIMSVSGTIGVSVSYIYQDALPDQLLYKMWWPLLFVLPVILILLGMLWSVAMQYF